MSLDEIKKLKDKINDCNKIIMEQQMVIDFDEN